MAKDRVEKTLDAFQAFDRAFPGCRGKLPVDAQDRFGLTIRADDHAALNVLALMDKGARRDLKQWLDDCVAAGRIVDLPRGRSMAMASTAYRS